MQAALMGIIIFLAVHLVPSTVDEFKFSVPNSEIKTDRSIVFLKTDKDQWQITFMEGEKEHQRMKLSVLENKSVRVYEPETKEEEEPSFEEFSFTEIFEIEGLDLHKATEIPFTHNQGKITIERNKNEILIRAVSPDGDINPDDLMQIIWEEKKTKKIKDKKSK